MSTTSTKKQEEQQNLIYNWLDFDQILKLGFWIGNNNNNNKDENNNIQAIFDTILTKLQQ